MQCRVLFQAIAFVVSIALASVAQGTPIPAALTVTDGANTRAAALEGELTEYGDYVHSGEIDSPTFYMTWTGKAAFEPANPSRYIVAGFVLKNLTSETQDYVVDLRLDVGGMPNGALVSSSALMPSLLGFNDPGIVAAEHRVGIPFLSLAVNDSILLSTARVDRPFTDFISYYSLLPPGDPEQVPIPVFDYSSAINSLGFRIAFSMTAGGTMEVCAGAGASAAPVPEPRSFMLALAGAGSMMFLAKAFRPRTSDPSSRS